MLTSQQRSLLFRFVGPSSIFSSHFAACRILNEGAKIQLLNMAITKPSQEFLPVLDRLFATYKATYKTCDKRMKGDLIVLHGLKLINDLYFNNPMRDRDTATLEHYFAGMGPIKNDDFKQAVLKIVEGRISNLALLFCDDGFDFQSKEYLERQIATNGDDTWRNAALCPPDEMMVRTMSDQVAQSIFTPRRTCNHITSKYADLPNVPPPTRSSTCTERRQYNNAQLISILRNMAEPAEVTPAAEAAAEFGLHPPGTK